MKIYNECFYKMRKGLEVEPVNFYYDYSQIKDKINGSLMDELLAQFWKSVLRQDGIAVRKKAIIDAFVEYLKQNKFTIE